MRHLVRDILTRHGVEAPDAAVAELASLALDEPYGSALGDQSVTWSDALSTHGRLDIAMEPPGVFERAGVSVGRFSPRYEPLGMIGSGGMGQVLRVTDRVLGREVAMKVAHAALSESGRSRFVAEAQVLAQLQHSGIVTVFDLGTLPEGQPYFTMPILEGRPLSERIREHHQCQPPDPASLRRLVTSFSATADAIRHAHLRGVVHRDLKPDNVVVGDLGETVVVDWGLAKVVGTVDTPMPEPEPAPIRTSRGAVDGFVTSVGAVIGTIGYMPPEQARGELDRVDARADVHALGATLFELLAGFPPEAGAGSDRALDGLANEFRDLADLARACLDPEPDQRPTSAAVASAVAAWLDGTSRRARAIEEVRVADAMLPRIAALEAEAAETVLAQNNRVGEARVAMLRAEAEALRRSWVDDLNAALRTDPSHGEAHERLANHWREQHAFAEAEGEHRRAETLLPLVRAHDVSRKHASYIEGTGSVTITTDPSGADVWWARLERVGGTRMPTEAVYVGRTPLVGRAFPMGSHLLSLRAPDAPPTVFPVVLARCGTWTSSVPTALPTAADLDSDDCFVAAGPFWSGGDPLAEWPTPARRVTVASFVIRRFPVTNREFVAFLEALAAADRNDDIERFQPRSAEGPVYGRDGSRRFVLQPDADGDLWLPDHPVCLVDRDAALAYAAWRQDETGLPWRLPTSEEWEKAARGVDGRLFPWGDEFDPSWCCMRDSHEDKPLPEPVGLRISDVSVYGVHDLAGNVHEWCADPFAERPGLATVRGGSWHSGPRWSRAASRGVLAPQTRESVVGFRLARSF